jgi:hypothetical protein
MSIAVVERMDRDEQKMGHARLAHGIEILVCAEPINKGFHLCGKRLGSGRLIVNALKADLPQVTCIGSVASVRHWPIVILVVPLRPAGNNAAYQPNRRSAPRGARLFPVASSSVSTTPSTLLSAGVKVPISTPRGRAIDERT